MALFLLKKIFPLDIQKALYKTLQNPAASSCSDTYLLRVLRQYDKKIEGMLLTMYDTRLRLANQVVDEVKTHFQELVFDTIIHRNTTLTESSSHGATVIMHDASSRGAVNYLNFAREFLQKNNLTKIGNEDKIIEIDNEL